MKRVFNLVACLLFCVMSLGGFFACDSFGKIQINVENYYEAHVEFYVNPEKPKDVANGNGSQYGVYGTYGRHVMDNIIKLLSSESFTEILIDGTDGVETVSDPMKGIPKKYNLSAIGEQYMTDEYKNFLSRVKNAVFFSYLESDADMDNADNFARNLIYVDISVKEDKALAVAILDNIRYVVPWYVEVNMPVPSGYSGTYCQKITTMEDVKLVQK